MLRVSLVGASLATLVAAPFLLAAHSGHSPAELWAAAATGFGAAVAAVGWVLVPQIALGIAIVSLALQQAAARLAGLPRGATPGWLDPAVESALLLGLLGTISGMVNGFVGVSPEELQPGPLVHSLGTALRSSFVGFAIALVGVWVKAGPEAELPAEAATGSARGWPGASADGPTAPADGAESA